MLQLEQRRGSLLEEGEKMYMESFHLSRRFHSRIILTEEDPYLSPGIWFQVAEYLSAKDQLSVKLLCKGIKAVLPKLPLLNLKYFKESHLKYVQEQKKLPEKDRSLQVRFKLNPLVAEQEPFEMLEFIADRFRAMEAMYQSIEFRMVFSQLVLVPLTTGDLFRSTVLKVLQFPNHPKFSLLTLQIASYANNIPALNYLLQPANNSKITRYDYEESIDYACGNGCAETLQILLNLQDSRCDPTHNHNRPIKMAATMGSTKCVQILLRDRRVDPAAGRNTAIGYATYHGHLETFRLLLQDTRVNPSDYNNYCMREVSLNGHVQICSFLLQDPRMNPVDNENECIGFASAEGHLAVVRLLLADPRVDASARHNEALMKA